MIGKQIGCTWIFGEERIDRIMERLCVRARVQIDQRTHDPRVGVRWSKGEGAIQNRRHLGIAILQGRDFGLQLLLLYLHPFELLGQGVGQLMAVGAGVIFEGTTDDAAQLFALQRPQLKVLVG